MTVDTNIFQHSERLVATHQLGSALGHQGRVVAFGLIGISLSEVDNSLVERIALAQVADDRCRSLGQAAAYTHGNSAGNSEPLASSAGCCIHSGGQQESRYFSSADRASTGHSSFEATD